MAGVELAVALFEAIDRVLRRSLLVAQVIIAFGVITAVAMALDRKPPFAVLSVAPAYASPGESVTIHALVSRDLSRRCSASFARYLYASDGSRRSLGKSSASSDAVADAERRSPGALIVSVAVPADTPPGPAALVTSLEYRCNRVHSLWPIEVTTTLPFEVL
jgi:hypothetical protein